MNANVRDIITTILGTAGFSADETAQALGEAKDIAPTIWVKQREVETWLSNQNGTAYVEFRFHNSNYKTNLRGKHQAHNCATALEIIARLSCGGRVTRAHIDRGLANVPLNGRFQTISKKPLVIFDTITTAQDMKNFVFAVDDYFGRATQKSLQSPTNLHPRPFKRLIICDVVFPELAIIKQNVTIIFTRPELQTEYRRHYDRAVVKTMVMPFDKALPHATENFPEHKIFIIGNQELCKKVPLLIQDVAPQ